MRGAANLARGNFYGDSAEPRKRGPNGGATRARVRAELVKDWVTPRQLHARLGIQNAYHHIKFLSKTEVIFTRKLKTPRASHGGRSYEHTFRIYERAVNVALAATQRVV